MACTQVIIGCSFISPSDDPNLRRIRSRIQSARCDIAWVGESVRHPPKTCRPILFRPPARLSYCELCLALLASTWRDVTA